MALTKCPECGKEISDKATSCPNCGFALNHPNMTKDNVVYVRVQKFTGALSRGRLTIGIISMVLFVIVTFQSCAVGVANTLEEKGETSGSSGVGLSIFMLAAGIVGVTTRNSKGKTGAIITAVLYFIGGIIGLSNVGSFSDLMIWGVLCILFGVFFVIAGILNGKKKAANDAKGDE